jgi:hypothetical protein
MHNRICRLAVIASCVAAFPGLAAASAQAAVSADTLPATSLASTSSVLNGSVQTGGDQVLWQFQYGTNTGYGKTTSAEVIPAGSGRAAVSFGITNLRPNTRYHFRLIATQEGGGGPYSGLAIVSGKDVTFTTNRRGSLTLGSTKLAVSKRTVSIPLKCASTQHCQGRLTLSIRVKLGKHFGTLTIASKAFTIRSGRGQTLKPRLSSAGILRLRQAPQRRLGVTLSAPVQHRSAPAPQAGDIDPRVATRLTVLERCEARLRHAIGGQ